MTGKTATGSSFSTYPIDHNATFDEPAIGKDKVFSIMEFSLVQKLIKEAKNHFGTDSLKAFNDEFRKDLAMEEFKDRYWASEVHYRRLCDILNHLIESKWRPSVVFDD